MAVWSRLVGVALAAVGLAGCYGVRGFAEYEHHSSIPDERDRNTSDQVGLLVEFPLADSPYATEIAVGVHYELDRDKPVFGDDPDDLVGTIRIRQPIFKSGR